MPAEGKDQDFEKFLDVMGAKQSTDAPTTEEPVATDAPQTESPETVAPATEPPAEPETDAPETSAPATEPPAVEPDDIPMPEDVGAAYKQLVKQINDGSLFKPAAPPTPAKPAASPKPDDDALKTGDPKPPQTEEVDFLKGVDFDEVTESPEAFNTFLNKFAQAIGPSIVETAQERVYTSLPSTLTKFMAYQTTLKETAENFYQENPDLTHVKPLCAQVANTLSAEHPEMTIEEVFKQTAPRVRKVLGLQTQARRGARKVNTPKPSGKAPQRGKAKPKLTPMQREIDDILASSE